MMLFVTMSLATILMDHSNVLAPSATQVLHVPTTMNGTNNCDENASCANTDGSFTCTCNPGFEGEGDVCTNIDECSTEDADRASVDQTPIVRIPLQDIFAHAQTVSMVCQTIKKTAVKTLTYVPLTVTITATPATCIDAVPLR